eukprot:gene17776-24808_t
MDLLHKARADSERSRHVDIRRFWLKECIEDGKAVIEYLPTKKMYANILTKPIQGSQFTDEQRAMISNWKCQSREEHKDAARII